MSFPHTTSKKTFARDHFPKNPQREDHPHVEKASQLIDNELDTTALSGSAAQIPESDNHLHSYRAAA